MNTSGEIHTRLKMTERPSNEGGMIHLVKDLPEFLEPTHKTKENLTGFVNHSAIKANKNTLTPVLWSIFYHLRLKEIKFAMALTSKLTHCSQLCHIQVSLLC
jgi:hypothetical protein